MTDSKITPFGTAPDGRTVQRLVLTSGPLTVSLLTWGAIVQDVRLVGIDWPLTLGSADFAAYLGPLGYFGAIVGPVANRIGGAKAMIAGRCCRFPANEGTTLLHGGLAGTQARMWDVVDADANSATLRLTLPDGEQGFPGDRVFTAIFQVEGASLTLRLTATSTATTLMNLANHCYWNLDGTDTIAGHHLRVAADRYLPGKASLPTGEICPVTGPFDLRASREIDLGAGFDHNFCLADAPRSLTEVATLTGRSGVRLCVETTEPGLQVYDGLHIDSGGFTGLRGKPYRAHAGMALEPQRWPDAPNNPTFPSILLNPGETYRQHTRFSFDRR